MGKKQGGCGETVWSRGEERGWEPEIALGVVLVRAEFVGLECSGLGGPLGNFEANGPSIESIS